MNGRSTDSIQPAVPDDAVCLLGVCGLHPSVQAFSLRQRAIQTIAELEPGDIPGVLSLSADGREWATGTKSGLLLLGRTSPGEVSEDSTCTHWRVVGEPVVDVCHVLDSTWVTSDASGRILIWTPHTQPVPLRNAGGPVVALAPAPDRNLWGISADGRLQAWDASVGRLIQSLEVPPPAGRPRGTFLTRWPAVEAWVWPTKHGALAIRSDASGEIHIQELHPGGVLAALPVDDALCTVGQDDRRICGLRWAEQEPFFKIPIGLDPMAIALAGVEPLRFIVLTSDGRVTILAFEGDGAARTTSIEGVSFCSLTAPSWDRHLRIERQHRTARAQILVQDINSSDCEAASEALHRELESIGFGHVSLALKAEGARRRDDVVGEVTALHRLIGQVPTDAASVRPALRRYHELLECTGLWLAVEEWELACRAKTDDLSPRMAETPLTAPGTEACIIESDVPPEVVIRAARAMTVPLRHRLAHRRLDAVRIERDGATPELLCHRLISSRTANAAHSDPVPMLEHVSWIQDHRSEPAELITFAAEGELAGLQIAIRHTSAQGVRIFQPVILLAPDALTAVESGECAHDFLGLSRAAANRWLDRIRREIDRELRGLLTEFSTRRPS